MLKKKGILLLFLCFSMFMLAGCGISGYAITEEEQDKIAEYSAGILLQHYDKYSRRLVKPEEMLPQETELPAAVTPEPEDQSEDPVETYPQTSDGDQEENLNEIPLNDLYHVAGMNVSYDSYVVCKTYPKNSSAFSLTAKKGQRLLIVRFKLKNKTSKEVKADLTKRNIEYSMNVDESVYKPVLAIQKNGGMNYLKTNLKPNASETAILVFEIPKASENPGSVVLTVSDGDNASTVQIK